MTVEASLVQEVVCVVGAIYEHIYTAVEPLTLTLCELVLEFGEFVSDILVSFGAYLKWSLQRKGRFPQYGNTLT